MDLAGLQDGAEQLVRAYLDRSPRCDAPYDLLAGGPLTERHSMKVSK